MVSTPGLSKWLEINCILSKAMHVLNVSGFTLIIRDRNFERFGKNLANECLLWYMK